MTAEERVNKLFATKHYVSNGKEFFESMKLDTIKAIRAAEHAAYERAAQVALSYSERAPSVCMMIAEAIRDLARGE